MPQLHEDLRSGDLEDLVKPVIHIDTYKATMGKDEDVATVSFEVIGKDAANDLVNFIENGYDFIMDAKASEGEGKNHTFTVFIEIERGRKLANHIEDMIYGVGELAKITDWRFRYYKDLQSKPIEDIKHLVPTDPEKYKSKIEKIFEDDMNFFFRKSPLDYIDIEENKLTFKRFSNSPVKMELMDYGTRTDILGNLDAVIRIDENSTSQSLWLTKYFGDYNITKYDEYFVFEDGNNVLMLKLIS
jgi:hypothetical protein